MKSNIFREYDIRGIVGEELFVENAYDLAKAIVTYLSAKHPESRQFIVGRDGRPHSPAIHQAFVDAILDLGFDVVDIGICPTPTVYFAVHHLKTPTALIITASHNPKEYNGIKMWGVWGSQIQAIKKIYEEKTFASIATTKGNYTTAPTLNDYIDYLVNHFAHLKDLPIRAIVDCGNGTGGTVMPELIKRMNWPNVKLLFETVDGTFPYHEADPTVPENMTYVKEALEQDPMLEVGLGLDGDCDRMNPMTASGLLVPGDHMLALYAQQILLNHPGAKVVCDIKSSGGLIDLMAQLGGKAILAPSGYSFIKQAMAQHGALLGGELSCHFTFNDRYLGYDDGIYAGLRTIEILHQTGKSLDELLTIIPHKISSPEIRLACSSDAQKATIVTHVTGILAARTDLDLITIDGIRAQMSYGWGLVRASNTQPVICLRFESDTTAGLTRIKEEFFQALTPFFDNDLLRRKIEL